MFRCVRPFSVWNPRLHTTYGTIEQTCMPSCQQVGGDVRYASPTHLNSSIGSKEFLITFLRVLLVCELTKANQYRQKGSMLHIINVKMNREVI